VVGSGCDGEISGAGKGDVNKPFEQIGDTASNRDFIQCACSSFPRTLYMEYAEDWSEPIVFGIKVENRMCWSVGVVLGVLLACCGNASRS